VDTRFNMDGYGEVPTLDLPSEAKSFIARCSEEHGVEVPEDLNFSFDRDERPFNN
jgi:hypothetical protein